MLFSPIFGSYLVTKNWRELGENSRARSSNIWFWASILIVIFGIFIPSGAAGLGFLYLIIWYFAAGRKQAKFVKEKYGSNYNHRPWAKPIFTALALIVGFIFVFGFFAVSYEDYKARSVASITAPKPTEASYENDALQLDYRKATLNEYDEGQKLKFVGSVNQIIGDDMAMIQTERVEFLGYMGQPVLLTFSKRSKIITDDVVKVFGRYNGTQKYETVLGQEKEDPIIQVDYYYIQ
ncbi:hypothetical protein S4A8_14130 [Salinisphaera sp. S4-8]